MRTQVFFRQNPIFGRRDFVDFLERDGRTNSHTARSILAYHVRKGHLLSIRRNLYAVVPDDVSKENYRVPPILLASRFTDDAVVSHHSALEYHGLAYSVHFQHEYLTKYKRTPFRFQGIRYLPMSFPHELCVAGRDHWGIETGSYGQCSIRVTNLERTMVDCLSQPSVCGGFGEVWDSLENCDYFRVERVIEYTLLLNNSTALAKVGYYLDLHRDELGVTKEHLAVLEQSVPRQPHYLDRRRRNGARLIKPWNLMVPETTLVEHSETEFV